MNRIDSIRFPQQGCTSDVGFLETDKGCFALKRTNHPLYLTWLKREILLVTQLTTFTQLPIPKVATSIEDEKQTWALFEFIEGETVAVALTNEKRQKKA